MKAYKVGKLAAFVGRGLCSNVYAVGSKELVLIDTGNGAHENNVARALEVAGLDPRNVEAVVLTHYHFDHILGLKHLEDINPEVYVHEYDLPFLKLPLDLEVKAVKDGDLLKTELGDALVVHTPGHTRGSICLLLGSTIFTGDTVFAHGMVGRTDLPGGSLASLKRSLKKLASLDVDDMFPGHGEWVVGSAKEHLRLALELVRGL